MSDPEFGDEAGRLAARIAQMDGEDRIAAACRGSANPAALRWLCEWAGLSAQHRVADVGAGLGGPAAWLRDTVGCTVVAGDPSPESIAGARDLFALDVVRADASASPFADGAFAAVWLLGVLSVVDDRSAALIEARRIGTTLGVLDYCSMTGREQHVGGSRFPTVDQLVTEVGDRWSHLEWAMADQPAPESWTRAADRAQAGVPRPASERAVAEAIEAGDLVPHVLAAR